MNVGNLKLVTLIILIILVILIITLLIIRTKKKSPLSEAFQESPPLSIHFLNSEEAQQIVRTNHPSYFQKMKPMELVARNVLKSEKDYQESNIVSITQDFYCSQILEYNDLEKRCIQKLVKNTLQQNPYPQLLKYFINWTFIKVSSSFEDGLPHTIDKYIVIPENFISEIVHIVQNNNMGEAIKIYGSTLSHEQIHVLQRQYPDIFNTLYTQFWTYKRVPEIKINPLIDKHVGNYQRLNPDGLENNYIFKIKSHFYLVVYVKLNNYELENVTKYGLLINDINWKVITNKKLTDFSSYLNYFGNIGNNYHPNELVATLLSENIMLPNHYNKHKAQNCMAVKKLRAWVDSL